MKNSLFCLFILFLSCSLAWSNEKSTGNGGGDSYPILFTQSCISNSVIGLSMKTFKSERASGSEDSQGSDDYDALYRKYKIMRGGGTFLTIMGNIFLLAGVGFGVYNMINPGEAPGSILLRETDEYAYYFNPIVPSCNLVGLIFLGIGIPLMIFGAYKASKYKRYLSMMNKPILPQVSYNSTSASLNFGVSVRLN